MAEALFSLTGDSLPPTAELVGFRGTEAISRPYELSVFVSLPDAGALDDALGTPVTLTFHRPPPYSLHGIVSRIDILQELPERALAQLTVVPRLAKLGLSHHSRLFTEKTVVEIIEAVLQAGGLTTADYELRLDASYAAEEHVCQYKESDLAFLSRWMEREGIYYYFDHDGDFEKLIIGDGLARDSLSPAAVRYRPTGNDASSGDALTRFRSGKASRPSQVMLTDYDYTNPNLDVSGLAQVYESGRAEVRIHGQRFFSPDDGQRLADIRAQEMMALQATSRGSGRVFHLRSGYCFELEGHGVAWVNRRYLCVEQRHHGNLRATTADVQRLTGLRPREEYSVDVTCIDAAVQYRPPRRTPWPRVHGFEAAVVDGPADSDYAQIDDQGRYRIIFHFDESGLDGGKASTAVRMMQPHAGNPEGFHFPLRQGTEVMIAFLGGDPDRPVIAGAVPNAHNPAAVTGDNHTRNVIHTGGNNRVELEDQDGSQWINISTPIEKSYLHLGKPNNPTHHIVLESKGNCLFDFGTNQDIKVGGKLTEHVKGAVTEEYGANQSSTVTGPQKTTVNKGGATETYGGPQTTIVLGSVKETYQAHQDTTVSKAARNELFVASQKTTVNKKVTKQQFHDNHLRMVAGPTTNTHTGGYKRHVSGTTCQLYPSGVTRLWGPTTRTYESLTWTIPGGINQVAATLQVNVPADTWTFISISEITTFQLELGLLAFGATGAKAEVTGIAIGACGIKREAAGVALGVNIVDLSIAPAEAHNRSAIRWPTDPFILVP